MSRPILILGAFAVLFIAAAYSQVRIIHPIYRPPPRSKPIIRTAREAGGEPLWLNRHDGSQLPSDRVLRPLIYDDIKMDPTKRYVRSLSTPSSGRTSGSSSKGSKGHDTGATHPGYNRRNVREAGDVPVDQFIRWPSTEDNRVPPYIHKDINVDPSVTHARSVSSLGRDSTDGSSFVLETGATQGNRRNTRSVNYPTLLPPFNPRPRPWNPPRNPRPRFPIYA